MLALGLVLFLSVASGSARAEVEVDVPPECGSKAELEAGLARLLGDAARSVPATRLEIGRREDDGMFTLRLSLPEETRTLRDENCRTLFRSAIVVAAAALRENERAQAGEQRNEQAVRPASEARDEAGRQASAMRFGVSLGLGGTLGLLPALAPRIELGGSLERGPLGAVVALHLLTNVETRSQSGRGLGAGAVGGRAALLIVPVRIVRIAAGAELDALHGSGLGAAQTLSDTAYAVAIVAEAGVVVFRASQLRLELLAGARYLVLRPRFDILGYGQVYQAALFGGDGLLRLGWTFF